MNKDIFEPYEKLIPIEICGELYEVPEKNTLLRCLQFLSMDTVSISDLCWNGECASCQVWIETRDGTKPVLSCRTKVDKDTRIIRLSEELNFKP